MRASLLFLAGRRRLTSSLPSCQASRRLVWNETTAPTTPPSQRPAAGDAATPTATTTTTTTRRTDFYDAAVERYAQLPVVRLSLASILRHERGGGGGGGAGAAGAAAEGGGGGGGGGAAAPAPASLLAPPPPERVLASARHVHAQLPRRLARRLVDLQLLPHVVVSNPHVQRVYHAYAHAFDVLRALPPPSTLEGNARFCALLRRLVDEHAPMLGHLAQGLREVKARPLLGPALDLDGFLDAMLRSRVSRRLLAEHHLALSAMLSSGGGGGGGGGGGSGGGGGGAHAGCVDPALDLREAVEFAAQRTALACLEAYGVAPEVAVVVSAGGGGGGHDSGAAAPPPLPRPPKTAHLPYVASHLDYMVSEILKNAMRAVSERHLGERAAAHARFGGGAAAAAARPPPPLPPLRPPPAVVVRICAPPGGDVTLRFSDQGGGIDPSHERSVWQYGWTTVGKSGGGGRGGAAAAAAAVGDRDAGVGFGGGAASAAGAARHEMAGLGFGLPLTRLYARYFGGELALQNMPGYGVDAFLTLRRLELPPSGRVAAAAGAAAAAASPPPPPSSLLSAAEAEAAALAAAAGWHGGDGAARPSDEPPLPGDAPQAPGVAAAASAASSVHAAQKDADLLSDVRRRRERARRERRLQKRGGAAAAAAAEAADGVASSDDEEDL